MICVVGGMTPLRSKHLSTQVSQAPFNPVITATVGRWVLTYILQAKMMSIQQMLTQAVKGLRQEYLFAPFRPLIPNRTTPL